MDKKILIKNARAIVSCDGEDRVYRDADMLIEGPRILAIGPDEPKRPGVRKRMEAGGGPGNTGRGKVRVSRPD